MEQRIVWPFASQEDATPFTPGPQPRPLRLTLHSSSFDGATGQHADALALLGELADEAELDILDFEGSAHPAILVDSEPAHGYRHITVRNAAGEDILQHLGISTSRLSDQVIGSVFQLRSDDDARVQASRDLLCIEAHTALDRDIFVTSSPLLLSRRASFPNANAMSPPEASRLAGLVLRTRMNWTVRRHRHSRVSTDRATFYWVLARAKLPAFWRYFSAVNAARRPQEEHLGRIAESILEKCVRALQALDEIAVQSYLPQNKTVRDTAMYHFDYLTLLLAGASDGLASVANTVYALGIGPFGQNFRNEAFRTALRTAGITALLDLAERPQTQDLVVMLHKIRNTIHSAGLGTFAKSEAGEPLRSYARVPPDLRDQLLEASSDLGGPEQWGIFRNEFIVRDRAGADRRESDIYIEPFSYAAQLVEQWFPLLDEIAAATDVDRLFPSGPPPDLLGEPPSRWSDRSRFYLLLGR